MDQMTETKNMTGENTSNFGAPQPQTGKTEEVASYVGQKAEDATLYAGHKVEDAASYAGKKAGDASAAVGSGLRSLGESVRGRGPEGGISGAASAAVADGLDSSGHYLQEEGFNDMVEDVSALVRRYPIPALIAGVAAGYLFGRTLTRS